MNEAIGWTLIWTTIYWLAAALIGVIPVINDASGGLHDLSLIGVNLMSLNYKEFALYVLIITAIGLADTLESNGLIDQADSLQAVINTLTFLILISGLLYISLNVDSAGNHHRPVPVHVLVGCLVIAFLAKLNTEILRARQAILSTRVQAEQIAQHREAG